MSKKSWIKGARVALKEDPRIVGSIYTVNPPQQTNDPEMYSVQWDKNGCFLYLGETLISEKEGKELLSALEGNKEPNFVSKVVEIADKVGNKFKEMLEEKK